MSTFFINHNDFYKKIQSLSHKRMVTRLTFINQVDFIRTKSNELNTGLNTLPKNHLRQIEREISLTNANITNLSDMGYSLNFDFNRELDLLSTEQLQDLRLYNLNYLLTLLNDHIEANRELVLVENQIKEIEEYHFMLTNLHNQFNRETLPTNFLQEKIGNIDIFPVGDDLISFQQMVKRHNDLLADVFLEKRL